MCEGCEGDPGDVVVLLVVILTRLYSSLYRYSQVHITSHHTVSYVVITILRLSKHLEGLFINALQCLVDYKGKIIIS